jgi:hypothetical protein
MGILSEGVGFIQTYLAQTTAEVDKSNELAQGQAQRNSLAQAEIAAADNVAAPAYDTIQSNPIINMGVDVANQSITVLAQQMAGDIMRKKKSFSVEIGGQKKSIDALQTAQDVVDGVFLSWGVAATAKTEVMIEMARGNARLILEALARKDAAIDAIQEELTKMYNTLLVLLNSSPFFAQYREQLLQAYSLIVTANRDLKTVADTLTRFKKYNKFGYQNSVNKLVQARDLLLPDRSVDITNLQSLTDFFSGTVSRKSNKEALAAAMSLPGMTYKVGRLMLDYASELSTINGLMVLFTSVLDDWIASFERSTNLDRAVIDHITAGTSRLDELTADMKNLLMVSAQRASQILYPLEVTSNATWWGIKLSVIVEWFKTSPGVGSEQMDLTTASVAAYQKAVADLNEISTIRFGLATLPVTNGHEDPLETVKTTGKILLLTNTVIATQNAPRDVKARFQQLRDMMSASKKLNSQIRDALTPFVNSTSVLTESADKLLKQTAKICEDLGFDRAGDLLKSANIKEFMKVNAKTVTYIGAASVGVAAIIKAAMGRPETTDAELGKLNEMRDSYDRTQSVKEVEAVRGSASSVSQSIEQNKLLAARAQATAAPAVEIAKRIDTDVKNTPLQTAQNLLAKAVPAVQAFRGSSNVMNKVKGFL